MSAFGIDEKKLAAELAAEIRGLLDNQPVTEVAIEVLTTSLTRLLERGIEFAGSVGGVTVECRLRLAKPKETK